MHERIHKSPADGGIKDFRLTLKRGGGFAHHKRRARHRLHAARNQQPNSAGERLISADGSRVRCAVIPTNEERMIALDAIRLGRIHTAAALA